MGPAGTEVFPCKQGHYRHTAHRIILVEKLFFKIKFSLSLQLLHLQAPSAPSQTPLWGAHRLCHPLLEGSVCCSQPACRAQVLLCTSACSSWLEGMWFRMPAVHPTINIRFVSPWCNPPDNAEISLDACRGRKTTVLERAVFHSWIHGRVPTKTLCSVVKYTETCSHSLWKRCISESSLKQNICRQSWWDPIPEEHLQGQACVLQSTSGWMAQQSWVACKYNYLFIYTETPSCSLQGSEARASLGSVCAGLGEKHGTGGTWPGWKTAPLTHQLKAKWAVYI